jgi:hypothetical protein
MRKWHLVLVTLLASPPLAWAGIGDVDPSFGESGRLLTGQPGTFIGAQEVRAWPSGFTPNLTAWVRLADASLLVGGEFEASAAVVHLDVAGVVDSAFAGSGVLRLPCKLSRCRVEDLDLQFDGGLLILTGEYYGASYFDTPVQVVVHRFDRTLRIDRSFGTSGEALLADYRFTAGDFPYIETYLVAISALANGGLVYSDDYSSSPNAPLLDQARKRWRYLDAAGRPVEALPINTSLDPLIRDLRLLGRLADGTVLLDGFVSDATGIHYKLVRCLADGTLDATFGVGGFFAFDDGAQGNLLSTVSEDGRYAYVAHESSNAVTVRRVQLLGAAQGLLDSGFGRQGMARIAAPLNLMAMQGASDGSVKLRGAISTFRLLASALPSPGVVSFDTDYVSTSRPGQLTVRVTRSGGADGALSVDFATGVTDPSASGAPVADRDFQSAKGRLSWADGEEGDRFITITILPQFVVAGRPPASFAVELSNLAGGTWIEIPRINIYSQPATAQPPESPSASTGAGPVSGTNTSGGGAFDLLTLLAAGCLLGLRRVTLKPLQRMAAL